MYRENFVVAYVTTYEIFFLKSEIKIEINNIANLKNNHEHDSIY